MIDTVILSLPKDKALMLDMAANGVYSWDLQSRTPAYDKYIKNPSAKDKKDGLYFPRLTGFKRKQKRTFEMESTIKIEFSAPKLLYKNNIEELTAVLLFSGDSDLLSPLERLKVKGKKIGIVGVRGKVATELHQVKDVYMDFGKFYTGKRTYIESENPAFGGTA